MLYFPISKVNDLRKRAAKVCEAKGETPEGWSKSRSDPMRLLAVFKGLTIKPRFTLRAYQFREGGNGNGIVWAVPKDTPFLEPEGCLRIEGQFLEPPRPPHALDELMSAIEGDGTPWSYLSASLFAREANEFGAMWHGCNWSTHAILGAAPWTDVPTEDVGSGRPSRAGSADDWKWNEPQPVSWEPSFEQRDDSITIRFLTHTGLMPESINRWSDTFKPRTYEMAQTCDVVAEGSGGYIF